MGNRDQTRVTRRSSTTALAIVAAVGLLAGIGLVSLRAKAAGTPGIVAVPGGNGGVMNAMGCHLSDGADANSAYTGIWVFANFAAIKSGEATEVDAIVAWQMKHPEKSEILSRAILRNWKVRKVTRDGMEQLSVSGNGFLKDGPIEHLVPLHHGPVSGKLQRNSPEGAVVGKQSMDCFLNLAGLPTN
jgi:hypothetical protein